MGRKVKYDLEFKFKCVMLVLEEHRTISSVAKKNSFDKSLLRKWIADYQAKGTIALQAVNSTRQYSPDFKLRVIQSRKLNNLSLSSTRIKFDLPSDSMIIKWERDFYNFGVDGLKSKPKGRPKIMSNQTNKASKSKKPLTREEELLVENERLRCENALLKKFNALMQAEEGKLKKP